MGGGRRCPLYRISEYYDATTLGWLQCKSEGFARVRRFHHTEGDVAIRPSAWHVLMSAVLHRMFRYDARPPLRSTPVGPLRDLGAGAGRRFDVLGVVITTAIIPYAGWLVEITRLQLPKHHT